jgi:hypothetical protein
LVYFQWDGNFTRAGKAIIISLCAIGEFGIDKTVKALSTWNSNHIRKVLNWRFQRVVKYAQQRIGGRPESPRALFIVGCQRSGTNMLLRVLEKSLDIWVYAEDNESAFDNCRLRPIEVRKSLIKEAWSEWVVFKSICDSQNIDMLLNDHPQSKAIWIYRQYRDVANSAVKKWGGGQTRLIQNLAIQKDWNHWMAERMSAENRALVEEVYHDGISDHTAAALKWFLRNMWYFDLQLDRYPENVLLVKYDDLVHHSESACGRIFDFLNIPFSPTFVAEIFATSINKNGFPGIDPPVRRKCEELIKQLDERYSQQLRPATL